MINYLSSVAKLQPMTSFVAAFAFASASASASDDDDDADAAAADERRKQVEDLIAIIAIPVVA